MSRSFEDRKRGRAAVRAPSPRWAAAGLRAGRRGCALEVWAAAWWRAWKASLRPMELVGLCSGMIPLKLEISRWSWYQMKVLSLRDGTGCMEQCAGRGPPGRPRALGAGEGGGGWGGRARASAPASPCWKRVPWGTRTHTHTHTHSHLHTHKQTHTHTVLFTDTHIQTHTPTGSKAESQSVFSICLW